jgi:tyrosinase
MAVRKNQKNLSLDEQLSLLTAWQNLNFTGPLGATVVEHSYSAHVLHSGQNPPDWGSWRFLPWHRLYLYYLELALQVSGGRGPNVSIPYWDWTVDQAIPDWLVKITQPVQGQSNNEVTFPINVWRDPDGPGKTLPPPEDVAKLMQIKTYSEFTQCLEMGKGCAVGNALGFKSEMHNQVHNWVGGTMTSTSTAPADIIFWMHHANVDRIWSQWQNQHPTEYPNALGCKTNPSATCDPVTIPGHSGYAWVLDPWTDKKEPDCRSIQNMGYSYV